MASHDLWIVKLLAALASALLAGVGCALARGLKQRDGRSNLEDKLLIGGNTLAAGILLSAGLTHMLPDAIEALSGITAYPLAPAIAGAAFCFLVVLGEVVSSLLPKREEPHTQTACAAYGAGFALWPRWELMPPHGCNEQASPVPSPSDVEHSRTSTAGETGTTGASQSRSSCCGPGRKQEQHTVEAEADLCRECGFSTAELGHSCHSHSSCCRVHRHADAPCSTQDLAPARQTGLEAALLQGVGPPHAPPYHVHDIPGHVHDAAVLAAHPAQHPHDHMDVVSRCHVRAVGAGPIVEARSFLVFFALCFHSVMEGLGMGSAEQGGLLLPVMLAILAHKGLAAFALGCSLTQSDLPEWKFWAFVGIFASGTPLGCLAGMLSTRMSSVVAQSTASGVCIALSSGTFLQVSSMELLPRAFAEERHKLLGCCCLSFGFLSMSVLAIWC